MLDIRIKINRNNLRFYGAIERLKESFFGGTNVDFNMKNCVKQQTFLPILHRSISNRLNTNELLVGWFGFFFLSFYFLLLNWVLQKISYTLECTALLPQIGFRIVLIQLKFKIHKIYARGFQVFHPIFICNNRRYFDLSRCRIQNKCINYSE